MKRNQGRKPTVEALQASFMQGELEVLSVFSRDLNLELGLGLQS
jgi:hypothetical protein